MKTLRRLFAISAAASIFICALYIFWISPRYTVPILMYHRFGYEEGTLFVTPENFQRQMEYLKKGDFNVISLDELARGIRENRKFRHNTVVITIDDGYMDNYTRAYKALKVYRFPATIFVAAGLIGKDSEFFGWREAKTMINDGISIGAHTKNHAYLPSITDDNILWDEIAGAKAIIEANTGAPTDYFCYPTGGFTQKVKVMVERAGYRAACTTNRGMSGYNRDLYELKRIKVTNSDMSKPFGFRAKLSGYYNLFRSKKRGD